MASSYDKRRKAAKKVYDKKVKSGDTGYIVADSKDPRYKYWRHEKGVWGLFFPFSEAWANYVYEIAQIDKEEKAAIKAKAESSATKNSEMDKYVENGSKTASSTEVYNKSVSQKEKSKWSAAGAIASTKGLYNSVKGSYNDAVGTINEKLNEFQKGAAELSKKANLDSLLKKIGLGDNKLLKALSSKFGLKSGLFDSWASDLVNAGMSFVNSSLSDVGNGLLQSLYSKLNNESVFDKVILNSVVKPLRYTGGNPNYKNTLLKACLESDMPGCLEYLDGYNNTKYLHTNNMWKRGTYAGKHGCWKVSKYILEKLNAYYIIYNSNAATGDEDIAFWYKSKMVEIFKTVLVYGYSNLNTSSFKELSKVNIELLWNFSYYGDNDTTFNKKYRINSGDVNIMAKIVNVNKFGPDDNASTAKGGWLDPGAGITIDVSNFSHIEKYIDPRNSNIKQLYVLMTSDITLTDETRLVNEDLYKRLKYPMLDMMSKSTSKMIDSILNSKTFNDLRYLVDTNGDKNGEGLVAGLIHNTIKELQRVKALRTLDDIYRKRSTTNNNKIDIGDFVPYVAPSVEDFSVSTNTSTTQDEEEKVIDKTIKEKIIDDPAFADIGLTSRDFKILDVTGLSADQQTSAISSLIGDNNSLSLADTRTLNKFSNTEISYSDTHTFVLYSSNSSSYSNATETNKEKIFKQLIAMDMIKKYSATYSIEALKTWYGETTMNPIYEKDANDNIIYDSNGNGIVLGYSKINTQDSIISAYLEKFKDIADAIKNYYKEKVGNETYTITFDNQGIGESPIDITNIKPYSTLTTKITELSDDGNKFVFLGWSTDPNSENFFDQENTFISKNIVLYAIWAEAENYVLEAKLLKENNSTLEDTVYGTVDHNTKTIYFPIKTKEKTRGSYAINISVSKGAICSLVNGSLVHLTTDGNQSVVVSDIYGEQYVYVLKLVEVPDDAKRIAYITKEGIISGISDSKLYLRSESADIDLKTVSVARIGCFFNGWTLMSDGSGKIDNLAYEKLGSFTLVYASLAEKEYNIVYNDKEGRKFSGVHQSNYASKYTYRKGAILDTPEKEENVFLGYFSDPSCKESTLMRNIPRFYGQIDLIIYADWIDKSIYEAQQNGIVIDGFIVDLTKISFYTRYVIEGGEQWIVTNTGLARYTAIGDKISQAKIDKNNTPVGIAYVSNASVFLCLTKTTNGRMNLYGSKDRGLTWSFVSDVTGLKIKFFTGTGFETLEYLTFYLRLLYQGILFELIDNKIYANGEVFIDPDNVPEIEGLTISGISVTLDGAFYLLIVGKGIYKIDFNNYEFELEIDPEDPTKSKLPKPSRDQITSTLAKVWTENDSYLVDTASIGSAYNNINDNTASSGLNDDFNIDDPEIIANILRNARDVKITIKTFRNASRLTYKTSSDGKLVPIYGPDNPGDWFWEINEDSILEDYAPPALWLSGYNNQGKYIPDISNPREDVVLELRDTPIIKERIISDGNLLEYHNETITVDNYKFYIGWNKNDGSDRGLILSKSYMDNYWNQPNKQSEVWEVKIDKYEMVEDEHGLYHKRFFKTGTEDDTNSKINKFYINPNGSESFQEYRANNYGNADNKREEYYEMVKKEQKAKADSYKSQYTVTQNANGTTRYDGITEDFYKYITGGCSEDATTQENIYNDKYPKTNENE